MLEILRLGEVHEAFMTVTKASTYLELGLYCDGKGCTIAPCSPRNSLVNELQLEAENRVNGEELDM